MSNALKEWIEEIKIIEPDIEEVLEFLKNLDLITIIKDIMGSHMTFRLDDIMDILEEKYPFKTKHFECLFDDMDLYDFMDYLNIRYGNKLLVKEYCPEPYIVVYK